MNRLQFILKLPGLLEQELAVENYEKVVENYLSTFPVLQSYVHLASFSRIAADTTIIISKTKKQLRNLLRNDILNSLTQLEYAVLLIRLDEVCMLL